MRLNHVKGTRHASLLHMFVIANTVISVVKNIYSYHFIDKSEKKMFFFSCFPQSEVIMWASILHRKENKLRLRNLFLSTSINRNDSHRYYTQIYNKMILFLCGRYVVAFHENRLIKNTNNKRNYLLCVLSVKTLTRILTSSRGIVIDLVNIIVSNCHNM